jgi:hypothetical protein
MGQNTRCSLSQSTPFRKLLERARSSPAGEEHSYSPAEKRRQMVLYGEKYKMEFLCRLLSARAPLGVADFKELLSEAYLSLGGDRVVVKTTPISRQTKRAVRCLDN